MPIKLKDGQMKVDLYTASAFVQTLDNKKIKPNTKKKLEFISVRIFPINGNFAKH